MTAALKVLMTQIVQQNLVFACDASLHCYILRPWLGVELEQMGMIISEDRQCQKKPSLLQHCPQLLVTTDVQPLESDLCRAQAGHI